MEIQAMAALRRGAPLTRWPYACPALGPHDCLVRVQACGICHSDLHMIDDDWHCATYPVVPGHEVVGEVVEQGAEVSHLHPGQRVGIGWQRSACLQCRECLRGDENLCAHNTGLISDGYGGFAEYVVTDSRFCFPIPDAIPTELAGPLLCGGVTVYAALRKAGMSSGQEIGVIGLGGLGHLAVAYASRLGNRVTVFTTSGDKAALAEQLGAQAVVRIAEGRPAGEPHRPLAMIINTAPVVLDVNPYLDMLEPDGTLTLVGYPKDALQVLVSLDALLLKRRKVTGSPIGGRPLVQETLDVAARFGVRPLIEVFPLADVNRALAAVRDNRVRLRAVLVP